MSRERREFHYTNDDGDEGFVELSFGPWPVEEWPDAPIMVSFEDARWMDDKIAADFLRWLKIALSEAKLKHLPNTEEAK